ncbi:MAG: hypothetical protein MUE42_13090, partial [Opitutaceae bacterium]|nr:hypothetical protein [Opitutaceae bacterium]
YTSHDGTTWSEPFAFSVVYTNAPDPALPAWTRVYLGAPTVPPSGTRFLKIEIHATDEAWRTQIGEVKLLSRGVRPRIVSPPAARLVRAGENVVLAATVAGRGRLRSRL